MNKIVNRIEKGGIGGFSGFAGIICGMLTLVGSVWAMNNLSSIRGHAIMGGIFLIACYSVWGGKLRNIWSNRGSGSGSPSGSPSGSGSREIGVPVANRKKNMSDIPESEVASALFEAYRRQGVDITPYLPKPNPNPPAGSLSSVVGPTVGSIIDAGWQALRDEDELATWTPEEWMGHNQTMRHRGLPPHGPRKR